LAAACGWRCARAQLKFASWRAPTASTAAGWRPSSGRPPPSRRVRPEPAVTPYPYPTMLIGAGWRAPAGGPASWAATNEQIGCGHSLFSFENPNHTLRLASSAANWPPTLWDMLILQTGAARALRQPPSSALECACVLSACLFFFNFVVDRSCAGTEKVLTSARGRSEHTHVCLLPAGSFQWCPWKRQTRHVGAAKLLTVVQLTDC